MGAALERNDVDRVAAFWGGALEATAVTSPCADQRVIEVPGGVALHPTLRRVASRKFTRNRLRLGLRAADPESATAWLIALGAIRIGEHGDGSGRTELSLPRLSDRLRSAAWATSRIQMRWPVGCRWKVTREPRTTPSPTEPAAFTVFVFR